jgi:hypothetical protein
VLYYLGITEAFQRRDFASAGTPAIPRSSFGYEASIARHDAYANRGERFENVYVVQMSLHWRGGSLWFDKDRIVVLKPNGKVLAVFGDRPPSFAVE